MQTTPRCCCVRSCKRHRVREVQQGDRGDRQLKEGSSQEVKRDAMRRRERGGAHVKPSTATTGSSIMCMVKYLHKRRVKQPMTEEHEAAGGVARRRRRVTDPSCHQALGPWQALKLLAAQSAGRTRMRRRRQRRNGVGEVPVAWRQGKLQLQRDELQGHLNERPHAHTANRHRRR